MRVSKILTSLTAFLLLTSVSAISVYADNEDVIPAETEISDEIIEENTDTAVEETSENPEAEKSETQASDEEIDAAMGLFGDLFSEALMNGEWTVSDDNEEETVPDYYGDDYYDTEGNASLVKENNIIHESEEMQFISVTTRDGSVFYVLIDYTAETDNVYFLNKVDAYDLYALLYAVEDEEDGRIKVDPEQAEAAAEAANSGKVMATTATTNENTEETTSTETTAVSQAAKSSNKNGLMTSGLLIVIVVAIGAIGFFAFKILFKPKSKTSPADEYDEDDITINEDDEIF